MGSIAVSSLGKAYKQYSSRWGRLFEWLLPDKNRPLHSLKWVLKDVTFSVNRGEAVGIVGMNGAGKSTLLKIITGTTQPTIGDVAISGRVAALLELGMGFHPDFTGRQNVFMAGQLQGLTMDQIGALMPDIEEFADIGEYIDQPVRVYSSGMQVRLAFAVATAARPDILIVDEALSVGDAAFQRKCYRRIEEFRESGTTLLFVTHDVDTVKKICSKALFIHHGRVAAYGPAKNVCDEYERVLFGGVSTAPDCVGACEATVSLDPDLTSDCEVSYGDGRALIENIWLEKRNGQIANVFANRDPLIIKYQVLFNEPVEGCIFSFMVKTREGVTLFGMDSDHMDEVMCRRFSGGERIVVKFEIDNAFAPGVYYLNCGLRDDSGNAPAFLHRRVDALIFRVQADQHTFVKSGVVNSPVHFSVAEA